MTVLARRLPLMMVLCAGLGGCNNAPDTEVTNLRVVQSVLNGFKKQSAPSAEEIAGQVQAAMAATDEPLALVVIPNRKGFGVMQEIETNGAYSTYGTRDRISMTLKGGLITSTRGLGDDLMSSDIDPALALISNRKSGQVIRVQRFLNGVNQIVAISTTCDISPGGNQVIDFEGKPQAVQLVTESCVSQDVTFQNDYQVRETDGRVLQSKQWVGKYNKYLVLQALQ